MRASNTGGDSLWSKTESARVVPAAPLLDPISNADGNGDYLLDWSNVTGATGYQLEEDDNPTFTSPAVRYSGANTQYQVYGQATGLWHYRVRASNAGGDGLWSNAEQVGVLPAVPALAPIDNADGDGEYLVDWDAVAGAVTYQLQEDDNPAFDSPTVRYAGEDSQYQVSEQEGGLWYYRVRAANASGESAWSSTEAVGAAPAAPVMATISNLEGDGEYLVDWADSTGATSYQLQEDDNSAFSSPTVRYTGVDSQYQVSAQEIGLWYYRVRASNVYGEGPWSNTRSVGVGPAAPDLLPINDPEGDRTYVVQWLTVSGATGYELEEDDNPDFGSATTRYEGPATSFEVAAQPAGSWYYRVRSYNSIGNGAWSATQSVSLGYRVYLPLLLRSSAGSP